MVNQSIRVQVSDLTVVYGIFLNLFHAFRWCSFSGRRCFGRLRGVCSDFVSLKICAGSVFEVLIKVHVRVCVYRDECVCMYMSVYDCTMFRKNRVRARTVLAPRRPEKIFPKIYTNW